MIVKDASNSEGMEHNYVMVQTVETSDIRTASEMRIALLNGERAARGIGVMRFTSRFQAVNGYFITARVDTLLVTNNGISCEVQARQRV